MDMNKVTVGTRAAGKPLGLGQSVRLLVAAGLLAKEDTALLERSTKIRNSPVHTLEEPTGKEVLLMLDAVLLFRKKYFGNP